MTDVVKSYNQSNFYVIPKKLFRALNEKLVDSKYPLLYKWNLISKEKVASVTGGSDAFKSMADFCDASGVPFEYMLCWSQMLLVSIDYKSEPTLITKWDSDFDGNWDFEMTLSDSVHVSRKPLVSLPKHDKFGRYKNKKIKAPEVTVPIKPVSPLKTLDKVFTDIEDSEIDCANEEHDQIDYKLKSTEDRFREKLDAAQKERKGPLLTKVSYTFGVQYCPSSSTYKLRYSIFPQKCLWGIRYTEKYRSFEDLMSFLFRDLFDYKEQDIADVTAYINSKLEDQDDSVPQSEEAFEGTSEDSSEEQKNDEEQNEYNPIYAESDQSEIITA